jgi:TM2 domain-containing membrane protein YozV
MPAAPVQVVVQMGGAPATPVATVVPGPPKSKIAAGLLGIFLGWLGIHRFYLGYNGIGVCQLLLTVLTCGYGAIISGVWGLVEGILILCDVINRDASGQPLKS